LLRDLVCANIGIHFDDSSLHLLVDRHAPLANDRGFDSMLDYYYLLKYDAGAD
jgi:chemotaxis protein methyltransferase CheR